MKILGPTLLTVMCILGVIVFTVAGFCIVHDAGAATPDAWAVGRVSDPAIMQPIFSDAGQAAATVAALLNSTTGTVRVAIYSLTEPRIFAALTNAAGRGVDLRIVADSGEAHAATSLLPALQRALSTNRVKLATGRGGAYGIMHHKFAVLDSRTVLTGSFNWTSNADRNNWENFVVIQDAAVAADYGAEWTNVLRLAK